MLASRVHFGYTLYYIFAPQRLQRRQCGGKYEAAGLVYKVRTERATTDGVGTGRCQGLAEGTYNYIGGPGLGQGGRQTKTARTAHAHSMGFVDV